ncbi:MAG: adenylosuccinate lyase [Gammaproteobacteria bacterium]|nr:adenylosuccinate lyase [Gammaproteobacteria bacterium]
MTSSSLMMISPLDGRYAEKTKILNGVFSEFALMRYRLLVEVCWLEYLQPDIELEKLFLDFDEDDAAEIKKIESKINHDVKAVEYFIKSKMAKNPKFKKHTEWVHFGCTSDDINNLAYGLMLSTARDEVLLPFYHDLIDQLREFSHRYAKIPMLSRTHGQSATPTTVGKEFANVVARLELQVSRFQSVQIMGKLNGAVGNMNAHHAVMPKKNWLQLTKDFVENLGLHYQAYTTQIEPHDYIAELFHAIMRINTILVDFCRDMWAYISLRYFQQKSNAKEVGSSTMPHKINPIDFENAEGNLYIANSILGCLADKLPVSRFQRDLVDSTLLRNMGVGIGHAVVAYQSLLKGLSKLEINKEKIQQDLDDAWEVLAEPIQMAMRMEGIDEPYEKLKKLTRGKAITKKILHDFIDDLELSKEVKAKLKKLTPAEYVGYAEVLAEAI